MTHLPPGTYRVRAVSSGIGVSNNKGTPYVRVTMRVLDGDYEGHEIDWMSYVTEKTQERVVKDLRTLGYKGSNPEELHNRGEAEIEQFLPKTVSIVTETEEFNGNERARVKWVNPEQRDASEAHSIFASMKAAFVAFDQSGGAKPAGKPTAKPVGGATPRPAPAPPADMDEDSIPFLEPKKALKTPRRLRQTAGPGHGALEETCPAPPPASP